MPSDTSRRAFLALVAGGLGASLVGTRRLAAATMAGEPLYASCVRLDDGRFAVALLTEAGEILALRDLPDRGHDVAFDPVGRRCVAFARRPGTFAVMFDVDGRSEPQVIAAAPGRHFYGHGVFSADGGLLFATENDPANGVGVVGIYDARDGFARVGEISAGGVGSHELVWCADGRTLAIANGGLETDPDLGGRINLNRADMEASLSLVDPLAGKVLATHRLGTDLSKLSIRHLAVDGRGDVWFGCQHEGDPTDLPPLAGRLRPGRAPEMFALPDELAPRARNYVGSVAVSADGGTVAFSAPRGGLVFGFSAGNADFLGHAILKDACGLAPAPVGSDGLRVTTGFGTVAAIADDFGTRRLAKDPVAFDNHLARLG